MNKLYACIVSELRAVATGSPADLSNPKEEPPRPQSRPPLLCKEGSLIELAQRFSHRVETIEDGVLFDVSGLHNRIGSPA